MAVSEEVDSMDISLVLEHNEPTSFRKVFQVNRTPTPLKPTRHWCMSTELLRSQHQTSNGCAQKVYNPFNDNLMQRLGETTISPSVFANAVSPRQENEFKWNIDDVSKLNPVHIEDECVVDDDQMDDETESKLQETIDKYFYMTHKIPSPWNNQVYDWESGEKLSSTPIVAEKNKKYMISNCCEVSTQTDLSFPSVLPDHIEEILKPYFINSTQNYIEETSPTKDNSNLRRKLLFLNDNDGSISPVENHRNVQVSPIARCFINSANSKGPVLGNHLGVRELPKDCHIPFDVSPITKNNEKESTPTKTKSRDFIFLTPVSTMSIPKRRRTIKNNEMESSSDTGYQTMTMSIKDLSSMTSFGHNSKNKLFTASTPTER